MGKVSISEKEEQNPKLIFFFPVLSIFLLYLPPLSTNFQDCRFRGKSLPVGHLQNYLVPSIDLRIKSKWYPSSCMALALLCAPLSLLSFSGSWNNGFLFVLHSSSSFLSQIFEHAVPTTQMLSCLFLVYFSPESYLSCKTQFKSAFLGEVFLNPHTRKSFLILIQHCNPYLPWHYCHCINPSTQHRAWLIVGTKIPVK